MRCLNDNALCHNVRWSVCYNSVTLVMRFFFFCVQNRLIRRCFFIIHMGMGTTYIYVRYYSSSLSTYVRFLYHWHSLPTQNTCRCQHEVTLGSSFSAQSTRGFFLFVFSFCMKYVSIYLYTYTVLI